MICYWESHSGDLWSHSAVGLLIHTLFSWGSHSSHWFIKSCTTLADILTLWNHIDTDISPKPETTSKAIYSEGCFTAWLTGRYSNIHPDSFTHCETQQLLFWKMSQTHHSIFLILWPLQKSESVLHVEYVSDKMKRSR